MLEKDLTPRTSQTHYIQKAFLQYGLSEEEALSEGVYTFITFRRFLLITQSLVFNEMGPGMTNVPTLSACIGLVLSVDSQLHPWLGGLPEGLTMLIVLPEALSGMHPLMANQMGALIGTLPHLLHLQM